MSEQLHNGHRARMKRRFATGGLASFEQHEIIEMLLFFGVPRKDTNPLAHRLIKEFGSMNAVLDAPQEELLRIDGVTENVAALLSFSGALAKEYFRRQVGSGLMLKNTEETGKFVQPQFVGADREMVFMICMDNRCRVLHSGFIFKGDVNATEISIRVVLQTALRHNSTSVIIAHNHPKGFALPSKQDISTTIVLRKALDTAGVLLVDHLIVTDDDCVSMRDTAGLSHIFVMDAKRLPEE